MLNSHFCGSIFFNLSYKDDRFIGYSNKKFIMVKRFKIGIIYIKKEFYTLLFCFVAIMQTDMSSNFFVYTTLNPHSFKIEASSLQWIILT